MRWSVEMTTLSRSDFLKLGTNTLIAASGFLGLGALLQFLSHSTEPPRRTEFDLGPASGYPSGSRTLLPDVPAVLLHTGAGFSALSLVCTHLGCTLEEKPEGFSCPCHGSRFGADGTPLGGPAGTPLATLQVEQTADGRLILYRS